MCVCVCVYVWCLTYMCVCVYVYMFGVSVSASVSDSVSVSCILALWCNKVYVCVCGVACNSAHVHTQRNPQYSSFLKGVPKPKSLSGKGLSDKERAAAQVCVDFYFSPLTDLRSQITTLLLPEILSVSHMSTRGWASCTTRIFRSVCMLLFYPRSK